MDWIAGNSLYKSSPYMCIYVGQFPDNSPVLYCALPDRC